VNDPTTIGRYKVINRLGHGGMGALFLAHDPAIDRMVAIKVMREGMDNPELRARFGREARAAGRLRHPNVVTIFDVGEDNGQPFIAMEYVPGETLETIIQRRSRLPLTRKLKLIEELCDGLGYAHKAGVVHRDIKPANLMLDSDGMLKILDFGIVRFAQSGMTQAGMLVGTLAYMSPEQIAGKAVDYRSDIFAVGDVTYELLTGKQAFPGSLQDGIMNRILHEAPKPLEQLAPGIDPEIVKVVTRALEKEPADRYPDLMRMRRDLARIRERLEEQEEETAEEDSSSAETVAAGPGRARKPDSSAETMPRPPTGSDPRVEQRREMEQRRQARIRQSLEAAVRALDAGDFQAAIAAADDAAILDPNNERAVEIIERAQAAAEDKQVRDWLDQARDHLNRGDTTQAAALVEQARGLRPSSVDVRGMQQAVDEVRHELELARERAQIVREAVTRARTDFAAGAFESAVRAAAEALARQPQHTEALEIREQAVAALQQQQERERHERAAAQAIEEARRQFEAGQHDEAIKQLEQFEPPHADVTRTLQELREQALEIKRRREEEEREARRRKIAALTAAAQQGAAAGRFDEAIGLLERVRELDPESQTIAVLLRQVLDLRSAAEAAARLRAEVENRLSQASAALERDDVGRAAQIWAAAVELDSQSAVAASFQKIIADKAEGLLTSARQASEDGRYDMAIDLATRVRALESHVAPADAVIQEALQRKAAAEAAARTRAFIAAKAADVAAALERDDLKAAADLYREIHALDSTNGAVVELGDVLQRRSKELLAEAREAFDGGRLDHALQVLLRVRELEPTSPAADLLERSIVEQQTAEAAAARIRARIEQNIEQASAAMARGQLGLASRLHEEAAKLDARHADLASLETEIARRRRVVETHTAAARDAISRQQYYEALTEIDAARAIDVDANALTELGQRATAGLAAIEREERRRKQLAAALAGGADRLLRGELDDALRLADEARTLDPENPEALALRQRVQQALDARAEQERLEAERRAREARIAAALEKARSTRAHDQAIRMLRDALEIDPGHEGLRALLHERERAQEAERVRAEEERREAERQAHAARLATALEMARKTRAHDQAIRILREALATDPGEETLLAAIAERERTREEDRVRAEEERREAERQAHAARVATALEMARKTRAHDQAIRTLREALTTDPGEEMLLAAIAERERTQEEDRVRDEEERREAERQAHAARVAKVLEKARKTRAHDQAIRILREALATDPGEQTLLAAIAERERAQEADRVRAEEERRDAERRAREARIAKALDKARRSRSHDAALRLLRDALTAEPENAQLLSAVREREAALEAEAAARSAAAAAGVEAPSTDVVGRPTISYRGKLLVSIGGGLAAMLVLFAGLSTIRNRETNVPPPVVTAPGTDTAPATPATGTSDPSKTAEPRASAPPPSSSPSVTPPEPSAPMGPATPTQEPKTDLAKRLEEQLDPFRRRARQEFARRQYAQALVTVQSGLKLKADDEALRSILNDVASRASDEVSLARSAAEKSGAPTNAAATYKEGLRQQSDAEGHRKAGRHPDAARGMWAARDTFNRAANEATEVANELERQRQQQLAEAKKKATEVPPVKPEPPKSSATNAPVTVPPTGSTAGSPSGPAGRGELPAPGPKPAETAPPPAAPPVVDERAAIVQLLRAYERAYTSKDIGAIRQIQSLSAAEAKSLEQTFRNADEYSVTVVKVEGIAFPAPGQATVTCIRRIVFRSRVASMNSDQNVPTVLTLQKRPTGWIIVSWTVRR
jgi:serine/threonine-protein kinase